MKSVNELCRMANDGWLVAGETAIEWYEVAKQEHLEASRAYGVDIEPLVLFSALASYNASPDQQAKIVAKWLEFGTKLPLDNAKQHWSDYLRFGGDLKTSKAECYRVAMTEGKKSDAVVIDRHMLRALSSPGDELKYSAQPRGVNERYNKATDRCLAAARRLGVSGCQLQALVWYAVSGYRAGEGVFDLIGKLPEEVPVC